MVKYEYCLLEFKEEYQGGSSICHVKDKRAQEQLITELNKKGVDGWHVVSTLGRSVSDPGRSECKGPRQTLLLERSFN